MKEKSNDDLLILVDRDDNEIGSMGKDECHDGNGILHRAFSIFLFNDSGKLLLQKRSREKRLWPLFWSNTCCSHPRQGESMEDATARRLRQELDTTARLEYLYKFEYQAQFDDHGSEHELCWVFLGRLERQPVANDAEIAEIRFVSSGELDGEIAAGPDRFTPWFKLEWQRLNEEFAEPLRRYTSPG
ncbi:MAG: isopentenyl-diphosphate Delta-isomerase [Woeseiaceae bacterium]|nr:isopentenyl-diphosphate Delta-isomerase [Woeseiaceae bacterium]